MERKHFRHNISCPAASSDSSYKVAMQDTLRAGHTARMQTISLMTFSTINPTVRKHGRAYVKIWGKKVYIPQDKVQTTEECGMKVYYE